MADATVTAGRGVLFIAFAKLYFMAAGYAIFFTLPRLLKTDAAWGDYSVIIGLASVIDNVIVTGTIQAVSRFTARSDDLAEAVKRSALRLQMLFGGGIAALYALASPWIAAWEKDASLAGGFRVSAGIVLCYAFYAVFVGSLNGQRRFGRQATLDVVFATLRATAILGAAAAGLGVLGAIGGFVLAAALILVASALWVGLPAAGTKSFPSREIWRFMVLILVYHAALNLVMRVDLFMLKRYVGDLVGAAPDAAKVASAYAGYYFSAQSLAFIPYQAVLAIAFVIFPLVSRTTFESDVEATRAYIRQTVRLSLVFVAGVGCVFVANPAEVIYVPYMTAHRVGGPALQFLAVGMICFSMFTIINTILNGGGRTRETIFTGMLMLVLSALGNWIAIPRAPTPEAALVYAALATTGAMAIGTVVAAALMHRAYGAAISAASLLRVCLAAAAAVAVGRVIPEVSKIVTLAECGLVFFVYFFVLVVLREFNAEDVAKVKRILGARR